ncbi:peptidase M20 domain-containing protein 2-like [Saccostrea echinata]|uniref:peptidase M20 domain-containing protein 2-like n=1 Tax=Saccostrea echinata TaxID=191078 RepID=UPI002A83BD00|nr:peptidase M20 domain-containing protein 2-like [Saccostrea echinata]
MSNLKQIACKAIDEYADELHTLSKEVWSHPELNFEEFYSHDYLTKFLEDKGFPVDRKYKNDTAFRAVLGDNSHGPHVAVLCEYDALPGIGHACGHNLIAEAGVAAGLGIKAAFKAAGKPLGKLSVIGTPAEEGGGGKIVLLEQGMFEGIDVAMMSHPAPMDSSAISFNAIQMVIVTYKGKASHAAAFPWEGVNALDAAVNAYQSVSNLRQQMKPAWRVHGIISKGGTKPNIIPDETELEFYVRAPTKLEVDILKEKVTRCFQSAATATGCTMELKFHERPYLDVIHNKSLLRAFEGNIKTLGLVSRIPEKEFPGGGSTDMGNVSYTVPSIHPMFYIGSDALNHTREFTAAAGDPIAQPYTLTQGKALAMTAIDVFTNPELLKQIKEDFTKDIQASK